MFSWHGGKNSKNHWNTRSRVLIYNTSFEERGTHWCWKYLIIPDRAGRVFPNTALDSLPYLDPGARRMGITSLFCEVTSVTAQNTHSVKTPLGPCLMIFGWATPKEISPVSLYSPQGNPVRYPQGVKYPLVQQVGRKQNEMAEAMWNLPVEGRRATKTQKAHFSVSPEHEGITLHYEDLPAPSQCSPQLKPRTQCSASSYREPQLFFHPPPHLASGRQGTAPCPWSLNYHDCKSKKKANSYRFSGFEGTRFDSFMVTSLLLLQKKYPLFIHIRNQILCYNTTKIAQKSF